MGNTYLVMDRCLVDGECWVGEPPGDDLAFLAVGAVKLPEVVLECAPAEDTLDI